MLVFRGVDNKQTTTSTKNSQQPHFEHFCVTGAPHPPCTYLSQCPPRPRCSGHLRNFRGLHTSKTPPRGLPLKAGFSKVEINVGQVTSTLLKTNIESEAD